MSFVRRRLLSLVLSLFVVLGFVVSEAAADDLPLVLSNEHIGLSGAEIEAAQNVEPKPIVKKTSAPEPTVAEKPAPEPAEELPPSEFVSADPGQEVEAAPTCETAGAEAAVSSFEHCIETAIRGGNGFDESQRVCRTLFPEAA